MFQAFFLLFALGCLTVDFDGVSLPPCRNQMGPRQNVFNFIFTSLHLMIRINLVLIKLVHTYLSFQALTSLLARPGTRQM